MAYGASKRWHGPYQYEATLSPWRMALCGFETTARSVRNDNKATVQRAHAVRPWRTSCNKAFTMAKRRHEPYKRFRYGAKRRHEPYHTLRKKWALGVQAKRSQYPNEELHIRSDGASTLRVYNTGRAPNMPSRIDRQQSNNKFTMALRSMAYVIPYGDTCLPTLQQHGVVWSYRYSTRAVLVPYSRTYEALRTCGAHHVRRHEPLHTLARAVTILCVDQQTAATQPNWLHTPPTLENIQALGTPVPSNPKQRKRPSSQPEQHW